MEKVSIVVPCYNQAQYLDECLKSVLAQTYQDWECIIVNDGSPDNTEEVAQKWIEKDSRFKYLFQVNNGVSSARNYGIKNAVGAWILPLDADDKIGERYLKLAAENFDSDYSIIYCKAEFFGYKNGDWQLKEFDFKNMLKGNQIFCSAFFRKEHFLKIGGYDTKIIYGKEDWEFWIRILKLNPKVLRLDYKGFFYRVKEFSRNENVSRNLEQSDEIEKYVYTKHKNLYDKEFTSFQSYLRKEQIIDKQKENLEYFTERINKNSFTKLLFKIILMLNRL